MVNVGNPVLHPLLLLLLPLLVHFPSLSRSSPVPVGPTGSRVTSHSSGGCLTYSGRGVCWGSNGRLPTGSATEAVVGDAVGETSSLGPLPWETEEALVDILGREGHACALFDQGGVRCFGEDGELLGLDLASTVVDTGLTSPTFTGDVPYVEFEPTAGTVTALTVGNRHACAVFSDGFVRCWGDGTGGVLGNDAGTSTVGDAAGETSSIQPIQFSDSVAATSVTAGSVYSCALFSNGKIRCWGNGDVGGATVGDDAGEMAGVDYLTFSDTQPAVSISRGSTAHHVCAIFTAGKIRCWGENDLGQLGYGTTTSISSTATVPYITFADSTPATAVSVGRRHTCALFTGGGVRCWGDNGDYKSGGPTLGAHIGDNSGEMVALGYLGFGTTSPAVAVDAGVTASCAVFQDSTVRCWGEGSLGKTGNGGAGPFNIDPTRAPLSLPLALTHPNCGDGTLSTPPLAAVVSEQCDDGNTADGDGCSSRCTLEPGWVCSGSPGASFACVELDATQRSLTCERVMSLDPDAVDGAFTVGPATERYSAWCSRDASDGGGWTTILHKGTGGDAFYTPSALAIGTPASAPTGSSGWHKLDDRSINLAQVGPWPQQERPLVTLRILSSLDTSGKFWYARGRFGLFTDVRLGFGLFGVGTAIDLCHATALSGCTWTRHYPATGTMDMKYWLPLHADAEADGFRTDSHESGSSLPPDGVPACFTGAAWVTNTGRCFSDASDPTPSQLTGTLRIDVRSSGAVCGDGAVDLATEGCDDGNAVSGDGCSSDCRVETADGFVCSAPSGPSGDAAGTTLRGSVCHKVPNPPGSAACGNGVVEAGGTSWPPPLTGVGAGVSAGEECDDGNTVSGDGCSALCRVEYGYTCAPDAAGPVPSASKCATIDTVTCDHLYRRDGLTGTQIRSGLGHTSDAFSAACIPVSASGGGGAYTAAFHYPSGGTSEYTPSVAAAIGSPEATLPGAGSDLHLHAPEHLALLQGGGPGARAEWKWTSSEDPDSFSWFMRTRGRWFDSAAGMRLMLDGAFKSTERPENFEVCRAAALEDCGFFTFAMTSLVHGFDTVNVGDLGGSGDDCTRILTDDANTGTEDQATCRTSTSSGSRCFTAGSTCTTYKAIAALTAAVRPACTRCGDGCTDPTDGYEQCDDGNTVDGDGCSGLCRVEPGFVCPASSEFASICTRAVVGTTELERSCLDHRRNGRTVSGVYAVFPPGAEPSSQRWVYCDMATDPDGADPTDPDGGWTLMSLFSQTGANNVPAPDDWRYDKEFRYALWLDGAAGGFPVAPTMLGQTRGLDLRTWSQIWRDHLVPGHLYEMRQHCEQSAGADEVDIAFDVVPTNHFRQTPGGGLDTQNWQVRNFRDIANDPAYTYVRTAGNVFRMWMPFRETDGPYSAGSPALTTCNSFAYGDDDGCCSCTTSNTRRYGNMGISLSTVSAGYAAFGFLPQGEITSTYAVAYNSNNGKTTYTSGAAFPVTCRYWSRPKPLTTQPLGSDRLAPLVRLSFEPAHLIYGGSTIENQGSLGSKANAIFKGTGCSSGSSNGLDTGGKAGSGVSFSGDTAVCQLEIPAAVTPLAGNPWTVMFWFKFSAAPSSASGQVLFSVSDGDGVFESLETQFVTFLETTPRTDREAPHTVGMVQFDNGHMSPSTGIMPDDTAWHHYALVSDGLVSGSRIYIDGTEVSSYLTANQFPLDQNALVTEFITETHKWYLGGEDNDGLGAFSTAAASGVIDDFQIFGAALSASEVASAMTPVDPPAAPTCPTGASSKYSCGTLNSGTGALTCDAATKGSVAYDPTYSLGDCGSAVGLACKCNECPAAAGTFSWEPLLSADLTTPGNYLTRRTCGDGYVFPGNTCEVCEECDDGNTDAGDGCSSTCVQETGFECNVLGVGLEAAACPAAGSRSVCTPVARVLYRFDNAVSVLDSVGNGPALTTSGSPTATTDRCGNTAGALRFTGGSYAEATESSVHTDLLDGNFMISVWVRPTSYVTGNWGAIASTLNGVNGWGLHIGGSAETLPGRVLFEAGGGTCKTTAAAIPLNTWTHIVVTWDGTNTNIFIDGALPTLDDQSPVPTNPGSALRVAGEASGSLTFEGDIDDLLISPANPSTAGASTLYEATRLTCNQ